MNKITKMTCPRSSRVHNAAALLCSPTLDRRMLEFSGSVMATGWLRRRDNAA